ncbi:MAG: iron-sulfur cluster assembly scaffold protein [Pseudomonadota bacterium]
MPESRKLAAPTATARRESRVCGSSLSLELEVDGERIADIAIDAKACALGQAAAALTARNIIGADIQEIYALRDDMQAMLKNDGPPPAGERWKDLAVLQSIKEYPARHTSTLLIFNALCDALDAIGVRREI